MNYEANRINTFHEWPANCPVNASAIARAGFYYTGQAQIVQCFICGTTVSDWNYGDQAMAKHRIANPECPFVVDPVSTCNVPFIPSPAEENAFPNFGERFAGRGFFTNLTPDLKKYSRRLLSFINWPIPSIVSPDRLARSGFYYLQQADMVECVYCSGVILKWEPGDDPDREHRIHFPNCNFYMMQDEDEDEEDLSAEKVELQNVKFLPGVTSSLTELGIQNHLAPRQPKYATYDARLRTFQGWPSNLRQTPEMLADAGFYYVGSQDQVRCFHCDGGLRNWEETDDAWTEHAKWFPKCGYVALVQGQDFIKQCIENRPPIDPAILASVPDDNDVLNITPPVSPAMAPPIPIVRRITDDELEGLLGTAPAMAALEIGLQVGRVKMALKRRMEQTGLPYANADELIEDATQIQLQEEDNVINRRTPDSPSAELTYLLNEIITTAESTSSTSTQTDTLKNSPPQEEGNDDTKEVKDSKPDKTASLEEENRRLREARLCKICMDREVAVVFLPCGHLSTCVFCAPSLTHCPMCRQEIRATVRTFFA